MNSVPGCLSIDHIGIAVPPGELNSQLLIYKTLGFAEVAREDILGIDQVREVLLRSPTDGCAIQLLEPLDTSSPIARQIEKNGGRGGIAHLAFRVSDIHASFESLKANGFHLVDVAPRRGSRGSEVFFVHPKTTDQTYLGFVIEVVQYVEDESTAQQLVRPEASLNPGIKD